MLIAAEMMGASAGLGWLVHNSAMLFQIPRMYAGGMLIILLGIIINQVILWVEKDTLFWRQGSEVLDQHSSVKPLRRTSSLYAPVLAGLVIATLFYGGHEVNRINLSGQGVNISHHNQSDGSTQGTDRNTMHHHMSGGK